MRQRCSQCGRFVTDADHCADCTPIDPDAKLLMRWASRVEIGDGCWGWHGSTNDKGYPHLKVAGTVELAHRVGYRLLVGPIPAGMFLCHHCDNPGCVKPGHMFIGTHDDNMRDMVSKGRACKGERQPNSKLTENAAREIKRLLRAGERTSRSIAAQFGIHEQTVAGIKQGRTWRHVGEEE
jgi:hypothetical protein